ncbi:uncharacterized protein N7483_011281 [Penicillium malachiteum]|uniref:uncharacterized protein n=1 Tax=Penicillium malachiteum TaxID=1324776 RepID=UPI0025488645|nr:uncharacterized protein N7483_011281 [Penicillium malachiteum]KAJ5714100.1 hypothetical protein N7483_011281 [Penicillium malachiteum]
MSMIRTRGQSPPLTMYSLALASTGPSVFEPYLIMLSAMELLIYDWVPFLHRSRLPTRPFAALSPLYAIGRIGVACN